MSQMTFQEQVKTRSAITDYLNKHELETLEDLRRYIGNQTGVWPDISTLSNILRNEFGYEKKWIKSEE